MDRRETPVALSGTRMATACVGELVFTQYPWLFFTGVATSAAVAACHKKEPVSIALCYLRELQSHAYTI